MKLRVALILVLCACAIANIWARSQKLSSESGTRQRVAWVADSLERMQAVKPGMTRADLLKVFTTEGGLSTGLRRTYVYRGCPYFKVDVEFNAVGRPARDNEGRVTLAESEAVVIKVISRPYLEFSVMD
jgi:hypothetical protein